MAISRVLSANVRFIVRHSRLIPPTLCPPQSPTTLVCPIIFVKLSIIGSHPPCWSSPAWFMKSAWHPPKLFSVWKLSMCPLSIFIYLLFCKVEKKFFEIFYFWKLFKVLFFGIFWTDGINHQWLLLYTLLEDHESFRALLTSSSVIPNQHHFRIEFLEYEIMQDPKKLFQKDED